jgi:cellulose synthase (UDP-forming)
MPNLELFANAGFPFTQLADLSETTVVLPTVPSAAEIGLYLNLMGHFGAQTGYPALRVTVSGPNTVISNQSNYLILGVTANQPAFNSLAGSLPVTADANGLHLKPAQGYAALVEEVDDAAAEWLPAQLANLLAPSRPSAVAGVPDALIEEIASPASPERSIVLVELKQDSSAETFADVFLDRSQTGDMAGAVSLLHNAQFESYAMGGATYHIGYISWYALMRLWLTRHFLLLLLVVTLLAFLASWWTYGCLARRARERLKLAEIEEEES